jgi:cell division septation protein DedD
MIGTRSTVATAVLAGFLVLGSTGAAAPADRDCADFATQREAQAAYDAAGPGDPLRLDRDGDGRACEPGEGEDTGSGGTAAGAGALPTSFRAGTYAVGTEIAPGVYSTPETPTGCYYARLSDATGSTGAILANGRTDGRGRLEVLATDRFVEFRDACVWTLAGATPPTTSPAPTTSARPTTGTTATTTTSTTTTSARPTGTTATTATTTTATTTTSAAPTATADDRDCTDFTTQAQAQAALAADASDPDRLDRDGDRIACEELFGTQGRQVAVVPNGGVATGGRPLS